MKAPKPLPVALLLLLAAASSAGAACTDALGKQVACPKGVPDGGMAMHGSWYDAKMNNLNIPVAPSGGMRALSLSAETPAAPPTTPVNSGHPGGPTKPAESWAPPQDEDGALEPQEIGLTQEQIDAVNHEFPGSIEQMHKKYHQLNSGLADMVSNPDPDHPELRITAAQAQQYSAAIDAGVKKIAGDAFSYVKWHWLPWKTRSGTIQDIKKDIEDITHNLNQPIRYKEGDKVEVDTVHVALMDPDGGMKPIMDRIYEAAQGRDSGGDHGHDQGHDGGGEHGGGYSGGHEREMADATPDSAKAQTMAAEEMLQSGDASGAMGYITKALNVDPQNERALSDLAVAQYQLNNPADASQAAHAALGLKPDDAAAQAVLKFTDGHAGVDGRRVSATDLFAMRTGASDGAVAGGYGGSARSLALASEASPSAALARESLAALSVGDAARALRAADAALASNPNNLQALNLRAMALLRQRQYSDALAAAEAGLAKDPKSRAFMNTRAQALNKLRRFQEAEAQARAAIAANPNDAAAWRNLAEALAGLGDKAGSLEALKKAAALDPRFNKTLETALQLPADADLNMLFSDDAAAASQAPAPAGGPSRRLRRFGLVVGAAFAAGLLLFLGAAPALKRSMGNAWTRITRRGPAVGRMGEAGRRSTDLIKGQFRPGKQIGFGGMGTVYEGLDVNLQRSVAIKKMRDEIKADPRERQRFIQEAKLVAALHHPAIVDIYAIAEEGADVYLVFEFIKGRTLYDHVAAQGRLPLDESLRILEGVVDGLEYAHSRGIIHRDLKPSNIMLTDESRVKVMDFGIARVAKDALTKASQIMTNTIVGTPPYMAPEQEQGLVRKESDVYALALCLYEMLTGRMAFAGTGAGMLMSKINKAYAPVSTLAPELPAGIDAVFAAALEPEPGKRLSSPRELLDRVKAVAAGSRKA